MSTFTRSAMRPAYLIPLIAMIGAAIGMGVAIKAYGIHLKKKPIYPPDGRLVNSVPVETLHWKRVGTDRIESPENVEVLGTENYVGRSYMRKDSADSKKPARLELHLAYYTGMIDTVPHVPDRCFVGAGMVMTKGGIRVPMKLDSSRWVVDTDVTGEHAGHVWYTPLVNQYGANAGRIRLPRDPKGIELRVSEFANPDPRNGGNSKVYAGYFFIANGGTTPESEMVRLLAFDLRDEYAYYCKVQFTSQEVGSPEELAEQASSLLDEILPDLMQCIPDWVDVERGDYPADNPHRKTAPSGAGA